MSDKVHDHGVLCSFFFKPLTSFLTNILSLLLHLICKHRTHPPNWNEEINCGQKLNSKNTELWAVLSPHLLPVQLIHEAL